MTTRQEQHHSRFTWEAGDCQMIDLPDLPPHILANHVINGNPFIQAEVDGHEYVCDQLDFDCYRKTADDPPTWEHVQYVSREGQRVRYALGLHDPTPPCGGCE